MCVTEAIRYICGHASMPVVRPCPLTTQSAQFPVCEIQSEVDFEAKTLCLACERIHHSRWVLIQEWEHHWLHERGACGCQVRFPDLRIRPRVLNGGASMNAYEPERPGTATTQGSRTAFSSGRVSALGITTRRESESSDNNVGTNPENALTILRRPGAESSSQATTVVNASPVVVNGTTPYFSPVADADEAMTTIPAPYQETFTSENNQTSVAVRIPSLFAAEWLPEHRALHETGQCTCRANFAPVRPRGREGEVTAAESALLARHRNLVRQHRDGGVNLDGYRAAQIAADGLPIGQERGRMTRRSRSAPMPTHFPARTQAPNGEFPTSLAGPRLAQTIAIETYRPAHEDGGDAEGQQSAGSTDGSAPVRSSSTLSSPSRRLEQTESARETVGVCGLPVRAGPEGIAHVGEFENCPLYCPLLSRRRSFAL